MDEKDLFYTMKREIKAELTDHIAPFWRSIRDTEKGGFYGRVTSAGSVDPAADKGCILNSRILWFFSKAYIETKSMADLLHAGTAYRILRDHFRDFESDGVFWSIHADGSPADTQKHTYCQAFAIYGLAAYYEATASAEALLIAKDLVETIEGRMRDRDGYLEAFARDFTPRSNEELSENGVMAERTMNTLLHVMEAYSELYRATDPTLDAVWEAARIIPSLHSYLKDRLKEIFTIFKTRIWNPEKDRQEVFFDKDYHSLIDLWSYGHDIETAWLLDDALEAAGDEEDKEDLSPLTDIMTDEVEEKALVWVDKDKAYLPAEDEGGVVKDRRIWWVQAEAVNGFLHAYKKKGDAEYLRAAAAVWKGIREDQVDREPGTEWYNELDGDGKPDLTMDTVNEWKCPYHNGRMCLKVLAEDL